MGLWSLKPGWDPFGEIQREVERLFDFTIDSSRQAWQAARQFPAFNLYETPTEYVLAAPLPGTRSEDLEVTVTGRSLTLKGERTRNSTIPDETYRRQERWHGKWSRTFQSPDKADLNQLSATLDNGLLILKMPKTPDSQPRQVPVKAMQNS